MENFGRENNIGPVVNEVYDSHNTISEADAKAKRDEKFTFLAKRLEQRDPGHYDPDTFVPLVKGLFISEVQDLNIIKFLAIYNRDENVGNPDNYRQVFVSYCNPQPNPHMIVFISNEPRSFYDNGQYYKRYEVNEETGIEILPHMWQYFDAQHFSLTPGLIKYFNATDHGVIEKDHGQKYIYITDILKKRNKDITWRFLHVRDILFNPGPEYAHRNLNYVGVHLPSMAGQAGDADQRGQSQKLKFVANILHCLCQRVCYDDNGVKLAFKDEHGSSIANLGAKKWGKKNEKFVILGDFNSFGGSPWPIRHQQGYAAFSKYKSMQNTVIEALIHGFQKGTEVLKFFHDRFKPEARHFQDDAAEHFIYRERLFDLTPFTIQQNLDHILGSSGLLKPRELWEYKITTERRNPANMELPDENGRTVETSFVGGERIMDETRISKTPRSYDGTKNTRQYETEYQTHSDHPGLQISFTWVEDTNNYQPPDTTKTRGWALYNMAFPDDTDTAKTAVKTAIDAFFNKDDTANTAVETAIDAFFEKSSVKLKF
jgi:hypothetical protein